eukprot:15446369-Alexandrium_andersonii.AAC.1
MPPAALAPDPSRDEARAARCCSDLSAERGHRRGNRALGGGEVSEPRSARHAPDRARTGSVARRSPRRVPLL